MTGISLLGNIIRPLLCATRDEIEEYLRSHGISFTDVSNNHRDYTRNRVRLDILPMLGSILTPTVRICKTAQQLYNVWDYVQGQSITACNNIVNNLGKACSLRMEKGLKGASFHTKFGNPLYGFVACGQT